MQEKRGVLDWEDITLTHKDYHGLVREKTGGTSKIGKHFFLESKSSTNSILSKPCKDDENFKDAKDINDK